MEASDPLVVGFVLFCVNRRGNEWPALYDEMCRVAGRHLYKGLGYKELRDVGLSFSLENMDETISIVETATASSLNCQE